MHGELSPEGRTPRWSSARTPLPKQHKHKQHGGRGGGRWVKICFTSIISALVFILTVINSIILPKSVLPIMVIEEWSLSVLISAHKAFITLFLLHPVVEEGERAVLVGTWHPASINPPQPQSYWIPQSQYSIQFLQWLVEKLTPSPNHRKQVILLFWLSLFPCMLWIIHGIIITKSSDLHII